MSVKIPASSCNLDSQSQVRNHTNKKSLPPSNFSRGQAKQKNVCFQLPPSLSLGPRGGGINVNKLQCCVNDPGEGGLPMKKGGMLIEKFQMNP